MIREVLPWGINAIVMAALLCALMSSADTVLLTSSTIFSMDIVNDLVTRVRGRRLEEGQILLLSRLAVVFFGLLALGFALVFRGVISLLLFGYSIYTAGLVTPVVFGFYRHKLGLNLIGAMAAVIGGGGWVILGKIAPSGHLGLQKLFGLSPGLQGVALSWLLLFAGSYIFRPRRSGQAEA
jgi:SSS family solute:Na+ symporter